MKQETFCGYPIDENLLGATFKLDGWLWMIEVVFDSGCVLAYNPDRDLGKYSLYDRRTDIEWAARPGSFILRHAGRKTSEIKVGDKFSSSHGRVEKVSALDKETASISFESGAEFYPDRIEEWSGNPILEGKWLIDEESKKVTHSLTTASWKSFSFPKFEGDAVGALKSLIDFARDCDADPEFLVRESDILIFFSKD